MVNSPDFKDSAGLWVMTYKVDKCRYYTLSGRRWCNMKSRADKFGAYQKGKPSYSGVTTAFYCFQEFAEWSSIQIGNTNSEWELDKDLLYKDNKSYCADTCVFIPKEVNLFINIKRRGILPTGVHWKHSHAKFVANCRNPESMKYEHLGLFTTVEAAFKAYSNFKSNYAKWLANKWRDKIDPRAYNALMNYEVLITD